MVSNLGKVIDRGEKIELLVDKTDNMSANSLTFRKKSEELRRSLCMSKVKMTLVIVLALILVAYVLAVIKCDGINLPKCTL